MSGLVGRICLPILLISKLMLCHSKSCACRNLSSSVEVPQSVQNPSWRCWQLTLCHVYSWSASMELLDTKCSMISSQHLHILHLWFTCSLKIIYLYKFVVTAWFVLLFTFPFLLKVFTSEASVNLVPTCQIFICTS
jgi:hypothetical protein